MNLQNEKCVMIIDESLPSGIIANTAAVMGIAICGAKKKVNKLTGSIPLLR